MSRIRRAISCVYCPPKSTTAILSVSSIARPTGLARASELLGLLEDLAFGLDRGGDDQLGLLKLADVARSHRSHARPDRAHEVQRAVLGEGGSEEDLLERSRDAHADAGAARQVHVRRRHPPVIAASGRFD